MIALMSPRRLASVCFILSGAASLAYQTLWLREAIMRFGVIMPIISTLLAVFMLGLMGGTIAARKLVPRLSLRDVLLIYAGVEAGVAIFALLVRPAFDFGYVQLLSAPHVDPGLFLYGSSLIIALSLLPACFLIGTTFPLMMHAMEFFRSDGKNFGALYLANLVGAVLGCGLPLVLIEFFGGHRALLLTVLLNFGAAGAALAFARIFPIGVSSPAAARAEAGSHSLRFEQKIFLFTSGFVAVGSEPLWVKSFTPIFSTSVYAFASVLCIYLVLNAYGSLIHMRRSGPIGLVAMPFAALLILAGGGIDPSSPLKVMTVFSILPICFLFGFLTPSMIDETARDNQSIAMQAYILNCFGCVLGPLVIGYLAFPFFGLKNSYLFLAAMVLFAVLLLLRRQSAQRRLALAGAFTAVAAILYLLPDIEQRLASHGILYRDPIGYVAAIGRDDRPGEKHLLVNGVGMTTLTTITKAMVHLPLALRIDKRRPDILIICMGMGTTLRSAVSWDPASVTVVELNSAVVRTFPFFHKDADAIRHHPAVKIAVDDGRRFLHFTPDRYDLITIDPPPPIRASGSGLLYSVEFIGLAASRLKEGGILAHWIPTQDPYLVERIMAALKTHFRSVRIYRDGVSQPHGLHFLASNMPLADIELGQIAAHMPDRARTDAEEFTFEFKDARSAADILARWVPIPAETYLPTDRQVEPISDDRLFNEYYRILHPHVGRL